MFAKWREKQQIKAEQQAMAERQAIEREKRQAIAKAEREKKQQEERERLQKEQARLEPAKEKARQILSEQEKQQNGIFSKVSDITKANAEAILDVLSTEPMTVKEINSTLGAEFEDLTVSNAIRYIERAIQIQKLKKVESVVRVKNGVNCNDQIAVPAYALYENSKGVIFTYIDTNKPNKSFTIDDIDLMDGKEFEEYIAKLFTNMGYITEITKASNDQGIDVIAKKDGTSIGIQAKRYSGTVGNSAVQEAVGGKAMYKVDKIMVITNNEFTSGAKKLAQANDVVLWDRTILKEKVSQYQY